jgi:hypothetical protein
MGRTIVCAGDSFTAGVELAADNLIPGYTQNCIDNTTEIPPYLQKLDRKFKDCVEALPRDKRFEYYELEKSMAWPAYLSNKKNTVYNISNGGLSNQEICLRTIYKLEKLKGSKNLTAIVMLTSCDRYAHPSSHTQNNYEEPFKQFYSHTLTQGKGPDYAVTEYWYLHHNTVDLFYHSWNSIQGLIGYCRANKIKLYLLDSCLWNWSLKHINNWYKEDERVPMINELKKHLDIKLNMSLIAPPMSKMPGGHFNLEAHKIFAEEVKKLL